MSRLNSSSAATPFLVPRAVQRCGEATIPGYYSPELEVWVVDTERGVVPIIECRQMSETLTKTHARVEEADDEDDDTSVDTLLELITKTHAYSEKDDTTDFTLDYESVDAMAWQRQR